MLVIFIGLAAFVAAKTSAWNSAESEVALKELGLRIGATLSSMAPEQLEKMVEKPARKTGETVPVLRSSLASN